MIGVSDLCNREFKSCLGLELTAPPLPARAISKKTTGLVASDGVMDSAMISFEGGRTVLEGLEVDNKAEI